MSRAKTTGPKKKAAGRKKARDRSKAPRRKVAKQLDSAADLHRWLTRLMRRPGTGLKIDLASLMVSDTASAQVMAAFLRDAADKNLSVDIANMPQDLRSTARDIGMEFCAKSIDQSSAAA